MYNFLFSFGWFIWEVKKNPVVFHHGSFHLGMSTRTHQRSSLSLPTPTTSAPTIAKPGGMGDPLQAILDIIPFGTKKNKKKRWF